MEDHNILITGGTGSLGSELVKKYSKNNSVTALSRDPHKQTALREIVPNANFVLGDICDYNKIYSTLKRYNIGVVIHTAALKQVNVGEDQVKEFVRVNIDGADIVARACRNAEVTKVLFISSDKAVLPINLYGKTKAVGEDIYRSHGYSVLRYGNVVDSRGSFIHVWKDLIASGEDILIRHPFPTRFFLKMSDAIDLVENALTHFVMFGDDGLFVPSHLESFNLKDFADAMVYMGIITPDRIAASHLLPGEKQHEILISEHESGSLVSDYLCEVHKGYRKDSVDRKMYCSETSPRIDLNHKLMAEIFY
jgi:UDP-N-acetylglucosamine 4,6-dehydratase/5-epimerase